MSDLDATLKALNDKHRQANRFTVYCGITFRGKWKDRLIVRNLPWAEAERLTKRLQERYHLRHPHQSSWTARFYEFRLGQPVPAKALTRDPWSQL